MSFYFMAPGVMQVLGNARFLSLYFFGMSPHPDSYASSLMKDKRWHRIQRGESRVEPLLQASGRLFFAWC
jgi:hypothetical protein